MEPSRELSITGPAKEYLTPKEVIEELGLTGDKQLKRLIDLGYFPPPLRSVPPKSLARWKALDVAAFMYLLARGCFQADVIAGGKAEEEEKEIF